MKIRNMLLCAVVLSAPLVGTAQWQWLDQDGRKVFSDRPPPAEIPDANVLRQPGARTAPVRARSAAPVTGETTAAAGQTPEGVVQKPSSDAAPSGVDSQLESKRKKEEQAAKKKEAEDARRATLAGNQRKKDNCERARRAQTGLTSGRPLAHTNDKGETGFMDEATKAAELDRVKQVIQRDCA